MTASRSTSVTAADPAVEAELDRLPTLPIADLRIRYRELFRAEPPKAFGPDLLRRSIAHRIQEKAYGGLPARHPAPAGSIGEGRSWQNQTAGWNCPGGSSQARTGPDLEWQDLSRHGPGGRVCLRRQDLR